MSDSLSSHEALDVACCFALMMSHDPLQVYTRSLRTHHGVQRPRDLPGPSGAPGGFSSCILNSIVWVSQRPRGRAGSMLLSDEAGLMGEPPWGSGMEARTQGLLWGHCWLAALPSPQRAGGPTTHYYFISHHLTQARIGGAVS